MLLIKASAICLGCFPLPSPPPPPPTCDSVSLLPITVTNANITSRTNASITFDAGECQRNFRVTGPSGIQNLTLVSGTITVTANPQLVSDGASELWRIEEINTNEPQKWDFFLGRDYTVSTRSEIMLGRYLADVSGIPQYAPISFNMNAAERYTRLVLTWSNSAGSGLRKKISVGDTGYSIFLAAVPNIPDQFSIWTTSHSYYNSGRGSHLERNMSTSSGPVVEPDNGTSWVSGQVSNFTYGLNENSSGRSKTDNLRLRDGTAMGFIPVSAIINDTISININN